VKFREIFRFEFVYQARRVRTWLLFRSPFAVAYMLVRTDPGGGGESSTPHTTSPRTLYSQACSGF
jgi:hypothetical protein